MRILLVHQHAYLPEHAGSTRHYSLAKEWVRRGHEVTIVASSFLHATRQEATRPQAAEGCCQWVDGIRFCWIRTPPYGGQSLGRVRNMLAFARSVRRATFLAGQPRPDLVLGSTPSPFAALAAQRLARAWGLPFVLEVRDLWPQTLIELGGHSALHPFLLWLAAVERRLYREADAIVSLLPGAAEHIVAKGGLAAKLHWIPNGVDPDLFPDPGRAPSGPVLRVVYAGAHGVANGLDTIVATAGLLQERGLGARIHLELMGEGLLKPGLRAQAQGLGNLDFRPAVPKREVPAALRQADACIATLRRAAIYEFGISLNKIYDYLASARPVVFGCAALNNPVAESGAGFSVAPEDPEAMAGALVRLAELPRPDRERMGGQGRAFALAHCGTPALAWQYLDLLTGLGGPVRRCRPTPG